MQRHKRGIENAKQKKEQSEIRKGDDRSVKKKRGAIAKIPQVHEHRRHMICMDNERRQ
jgi:hypothetical protein